MLKPNSLITGLLMTLPFAPASFGEDQDLADAKRANVQELQRLDDELEAARRNHARAVLATQRKLLKAYSGAILRAQDAGDKELVERLRKEKRELESNLPTPIDCLGDETIYQCVLGMYGRSIRAAKYPVVNLRPPNRDLWNDQVQEKVRGKITYEGIEHIGTAKLVIQAEGVYTIDLPQRGTAFRLNGKLMTAGDVELARGVYSVEIHTHSWGQPYVPYAFAAVRNKISGEPIPFVNTGKAIKKFLEQRINGRRVFEVSGYQPKAVDIRIEAPAGRT